MSCKYIIADACVLRPASLRDTLLRFAETPRLYIPKLSDQMWAEVARNPESHRKLSPGWIAQLIVTSNLRDFPPSSLSEWDVEARHPDQFLMDLYALDPEAVASRLRDQARR
jgi:hypothetical protein